MTPQIATGGVGITELLKIFANSLPELVGTNVRLDHPKNACPFAVAISSNSSSISSGEWTLASTGCVLFNESLAIASPVLFLLFPTKSCQIFHCGKAQLTTL